MNECHLCKSLNVRHKQDAEFILSDSSNNKILCCSEHFSNSLVGTKNIISIVSINGEDIVESINYCMKVWE